MTLSWGTAQSGPPSPHGGPLLPASGGLGAHSEPAPPVRASRVGAGQAGGGGGFVGFLVHAVPC